MTIVRGRRMKGEEQRIRKEAPDLFVPLAANDFDSGTFSFPTEEQPEIPQVVFFSREARFIRISTLQS